MSSHPKYIDCPMIIQMEGTECGAASLAMVMAYYKVFMPLESLRDECGVSRDGSRASTLLKVARNYNFSAQGYKEEHLDKLTEHQLPLIIFWNFNHFVVYCGKRGKQHIINDPAIGVRYLSEQEMDESFSGILLEIKPNENFVKLGKEQSLISHLYQRVAGCRAMLIILFIIGMLLVPLNLLSPNFSKIFIDNFLVDRYYNWGTPLISFGLLTLMLMLMLNMIQAKSLINLNLQVSLIGSTEFLYKLLRLPVKFFSNRQAGELSNRVQLNDKVATFISEQLVANILSMLTLIFYALMMYIYDHFLGLIAAIMGLMILLLLKNGLKQRKIIGQSIQNDLGMLQGSTVSSIMLIETLKASGGEDDSFVAWGNYQASTILSRQKLDSSTILMSALPNSVQKITVALVTGLGAFRILAGTMTGGGFIVFQMLLNYFFMPLEQLVNMGNSLQELDASLKRLNDINYCEDDPYLTSSSDVTDVISQPKLNGKLEIKSLTFGYNITLSPVVKDFNLTIQPGERVALVGASGSGKSTIGKLVSGLYQPWSGEILFDGKSREEYKNRELFNSFAIVDQELFFFAGTIYDNLTLFDNSIAISSVEQAARDAEVYDLIVRRSNGFFSRIDESGDNFSGGERQRLELARALTANPRLLILDEATSALDADTEQRVDRNLRRRGVSCLIIAHRLSTVRDADKIIVLEQGEIKECGTHDELIAQDGIYCQIAGEMS